MDNIWWNQVTNAVRFKNDIKDALLNEKSILIKYTDDMPWKDRFREYVQDAVKEVSGEKKFEDIPFIKDPGAYLLKEYCKPAKQAEYRPQKGYPKFFAESDDIVFHDRYFWVKVENAKHLDNWSALASDYFKARPREEKKAVFIFDWQGAEKPSLKKGFTLFSLDDYIGDYDRIVFAVLASSSRRETPFLNSYLAELVSTMIGNDIELAAECINDREAFMSDPLACIRKIVANGLRSDGNGFNYAKTPDEVDHLIWRAQIKTVYPHLEEYREDFVRDHYAEINAHLPIIGAMGDQINDPEDVELGTLLFMSGRNYINLEPQEKTRLKLFRDARNKLSHLSHLSLSEIKELL